MKGKCTHCGELFPQLGKRGPFARYCSGRCRTRAHRARRAATATKVTIPACMRMRHRWVRHDERKRPLTVHGWHASVTRPESWTTYTRASNSEVGVGMGFVLGNGIGCIDMDDCIDSKGNVAPWAQKYLNRRKRRAILVEKSRSGRGIHIFMRMPEAKGQRIRKGPMKVEIYSRERYIAVTGDRLL